MAATADGPAQQASLRLEKSDVTHVPICVQMDGGSTSAPPSVSCANPNADIDSFDVDSCGEMGWTGGGTGGGVGGGGGGDGETGARC